jgi:hypothetical protein
MKQEVWIGGPQRCPNYRKRNRVRGIKFEVYPKERGSRYSWFLSTIDYSRMWGQYKSKRQIVIGGP